MSGSPFPDVRWGSENSRLRKPATVFASTKPGSWLIRTLTPLDRRILTRTRGRYTVLGPIGAPTLLLRTIGAKSGQPRTTPLLYARQDEQLLVIGSNFGQARHPAWSANLLAHPGAVVTMGGKDIAVTARLLSAQERQGAIDSFIALSGVYAAYLQRTDRAIRVFALTADQAA
ncbi:MAG: nitroreductase family deazaflavin-dependent oxidoreductase [Actinomycetota bacterium]|nr:nitroreductase family deazaflavin-dependent oxidoreductase [Actinomycetota bacterium]